MQRTQSGFTLIELLVVISIIGVLAAVLLPKVIGSKDAANAFADGAQMSRDHAFWFEQYQQKHTGFLPPAGGYQFVMSLWTSKIFDHTPENLDKFFTPGNLDPEWQSVRKEMEQGVDPWPDLNSTTSASTHYCGRAKDKLRTATQSESEAWMADDNEGIWNLRDGTVNILLNGGRTRTYSYQQLMENFGVGDLDRANPVQTWGPNSPIPECQNLDN